MNHGTSHIHCPGKVIYHKEICWNKFITCSGDDDDLIRSGEEDGDDEDYFPSDEAEDEMASDDGESYFMDEETKSRFTNYSMTSSVVRRNDGKFIRNFQCRRWIFMIIKSVD